MPIEGFDYKEFARNLSEQVGPALPPEIQDPDRQYIINIVFNFCYMAGEAVANDPNLNFNAEQASMVAQFIGEWSFHKAIDIIKSGIDPQFRDGILQKIAFTVFEIAKTALVKNLPQPETIAIVEHHVKKAYGEALEELKAKGVLSEAEVQNALSHSNIDDMAKIQAEQEALMEQQQMQMQQQQQQQIATQQPAAPLPQQSLDYFNSPRDTKLLKLVTFSLIMKYLPDEKRECLLNNFSPEDASVLRDYASMEDIETKLDKYLVMKCLSEIKKALPEPRILDITKVNAKLYEIVKNSDFSTVSNIIKKERQLVKDFVNTTKGKPMRYVPTRIANIICSHIEEKLS